MACMAIYCPESPLQGTVEALRELTAVCRRLGHRIYGVLTYLLETNTVMWIWCIEYGEV